MASLGFGDCSGRANETDMLMRNSNTGAFEVYDISNNTIASTGPMVGNCAGLRRNSRARREFRSDCADERPDAPDRVSFSSVAASVSLAPEGANCCAKRGQRICRPKAVSRCARVEQHSEAIRDGHCGQ